MRMTWAIVTHVSNRSALPVSSNQQVTEAVSLTLRQRCPTDTLSQTIKQLHAAERETAADRLARNSPTASPLRRLAELCMLRQKYTEAEAYAELAASRGSPRGYSYLARSRGSRGELKEAVRLAVLADDHGEVEALSKLSQFLEQTGRSRDAEYVAVEATRRGDVDALARLGYMKERHGLHDEAERLVRIAATAGSRHGLNVLAQMRLDSGLRADAERLALLAANRGIGAGQQLPPIWQELWPSGLEPDGTPTTDEAGSFEEQ
ncbi:hypothetical protein [Streptomyces sp. ME19-01-6]|uniref:hypothetical protein n=1 Tax=Streptomyces sp. ME19-01-6 TaxID=3028686 RepID=UPI0029AEE35E|nr:hypothetical protein [Streptomyces sp. ME19-01-6]MDX3231850.1 hypothetical protein [Streptomyces sp. ME19-01-6]